MPLQLYCTLLTTIFNGKKCITVVLVGQKFRKAIGSAPASPTRKPARGPDSKKRSRQDVANSAQALTNPVKVAEDRSQLVQPHTSSMIVVPETSLGAVMAGNVGVASPAPHPPPPLRGHPSSPTFEAEAAEKKRKTTDEVLPDEFNIDGFLDSLNYASNSG